MRGDTVRRWLTRVAAVALALMLACSQLPGRRAATRALPPKSNRIADSKSADSASNLPARLSQTGLYVDARSRRLNPEVLPFAPAFELWSDGAEKARWLWLPPGETIDARDADHWQFPVGTRAWKEFRRGGRVLETRYIERVGPGPADYRMAAFVWNEAGTEAWLREQGEANVQGTDHDVPPARACAACHGGEPGRLLGFSAIQLRGAALERLVRERRLKPAPSLPDFRATPEVHAALGYLHANCGHCHSDTGLAFRETDLILRRRVGETLAERTDIYRTTLGVPLSRPSGANGPGAQDSQLRIAAGFPGRSGLLSRVRALDPAARMPPLGTEHVDANGSARLERWIAGLPMTAP
jgi:hypothetical protein